MSFTEESPVPSMGTGCGGEGGAGVQDGAEVLAQGLNDPFIHNYWAGNGRSR